MRREKAALREKPIVLASGFDVREGDPMLEADGDRIDVIPESDNEGTTENVAKKATGREALLAPG